MQHNDVFGIRTGNGPDVSASQLGRGNIWNMLNETLARSILERLEESADYRVQLISCAGVILAGADAGRNGVIYEPVRSMLREGLSSLEISDPFELNLLIGDANHPDGVLRVSGEEETVRPVAPVLRRSVELLLSYEAGKTARVSRRDDREQLLHDLLYLEPGEDNQLALYELFDKLGYRRDLPRIPVLLSVRASCSAAEVLKAARELLPLSRQDLLTQDQRGRPVLFLSYPDSMEGFFERSRFYVEQACREFRTWCLSRGMGLQICVGPMQIDPVNYRYGYEKAIWLLDSVRSSDQDVVSFYDHVGNYLRSLLPIQELQQIFGACSVGYPEVFSQLLVEHMQALQENGYRFQESSRQLYIHKNTLAFRLNKIREQLGADPIQNLKDRELVEYLCYYLQQAGKASSGT